MSKAGTMFHLTVAMSDVERRVYETLDLRVAQHPSETMRYLLTRVLAYCLSYEEGITFSKGGLSSTEEPPVAIYDRTGILTTWIDVGAPSAERLHKASKRAARVALFTHADLVLLKREAQSQAIHRLDEIEVYALEASFLDAMAERLDRTTKLELVRNEERLYATIDGRVIEGGAGRTSLATPPPDAGA